MSTTIPDSYRYLWNTIETDSDTLFSLSQHVLQDLYYFIIGTLGGIMGKILRITE